MRDEARNIGGMNSKQYWAGLGIHSGSSKKHRWHGESGGCGRPYIELLRTGIFQGRIDVENPVFGTLSSTEPVYLLIHHEDMVPRRSSYVFKLM